ncbi:MAG: hypothetical protein ACRD30_07145, partial [Bryobacteraceae bacterium]
MRLFAALCTVCAIAPWIFAQDLNGDAWRLESEGHGKQAFESLRKAALDSPGDAAALRAYAEFLDRHRNPDARAAYEKLSEALDRANAPAAQRAAVERREAILDLIAGDRDGAARHLEKYRAAAGDSALKLPAARPAAAPEYIEIPGPLRSFARMAALSPDLAAEDLLPALARNIVTNGYQANNSNETLEQTEYMKLVVRYLSQARELERLAGDSKIIKVPSCDSTQTGDLLRVLGYRMRGGCGSGVVLETVNASRAFLTIDSGFPLAEFEQSLRTDRPFVLDYHPARVPLLYQRAYWQPAKDNSPFIDYFTADPSLCRLYIALSKLDPATADALRKSVPAARLKVYAHVLDFFGSMFEIRGGKAVVPGVARSEKAWADLAGTSPDKGAGFFERLIVKDDGWLASYYDSLARINGPVEDYLTDPARLKRFYVAVRGRVSSPGPARPVFRANADLLLLTTRLRLDADGKPHLPGGLDIWKNLFVNHPRGKHDARLTRAAANWKEPDDVLEALFGLCRKPVENEPLKIFMALSDLDRNRTEPLETASVDRLAREYRAMGAQYPLFAEAPSLSGKTIGQFLDTAHSIDQIRNIELRADAAGTMQALSGLWQIFVRQGSIPAGASDAALASVLAPFTGIENDRELFDAGRSGVERLLQAARSPAKTSPQDNMLDLLAGTGAGENSDVHRQVIEDMIRIFEAQKLVSLDTLFGLAKDFENASRGQKFNAALSGKLASRISEIALPREELGATENNSMAFGYWT